jgi:hypothetical protein
VASGLEVITEPALRAPIAREATCWRWAGWRLCSARAISTSCTPIAPRPGRSGGWRSAGRGYPGSCTPTTASLPSVTVACAPGGLHRDRAAPGPDHRHRAVRRRRGRRGGCPAGTRRARPGPHDRRDRGRAGPAQRDHTRLSSGGAAAGESGATHPAAHPPKSQSGQDHSRTVAMLAGSTTEVLGRATGRQRRASPVRPGGGL